MSYECDADGCERTFDSERGRSIHFTQVHKDEHPWTDPDRLSRLYHEQNMNQAEIADELDTARTVISEWMRRHGIETRSNSEAKLNERDEKPWHDEETLRRLYHNEKKSLREIADELGCASSIVGRWMDRFEIERRDRLEAVRMGPAPYGTGINGHTVWHGPDQTTVGVHRLLAVADGADPTIVFGGDHHVHHKNGIPWDNRPENLAVLTVSEHRSLHAKQMKSGEMSQF